MAVDTSQDHLFAPWTVGSVVTATWNDPLGGGTHKTVCSVLTVSPDGLEDLTIGQRLDLKTRHPKTGELVVLRDIPRAGAGSEPPFWRPVSKRFQR